MKKYLLGLAAALLLVHSGPAQAQPLQSSLTYEFGLRQVVTDTLRPALEWTIRYELLKESENPQWHHFNYAFWTQGYQTFSEDIKDVDHMELGASIFGRYYHSDLAPLAPEVADHCVDLLERSKEAGGPGLTKDEEKELDALMDAAQRHRIYFGYSADAKFVTDARVVNKLFVGGLGVQAEVPLPFVDGLLANTRGGDTFQAQPVRLALSAEYVKGLDERNDEYPRAWMEAVWSSRIFDKLYPRIKWQGEIDSNRRPEGQRAFNSFLDAGLALPITSQTSVVFKYLVGRTAPNYEKVNAAVLGFDVMGW